MSQAGHHAGAGQQTRISRQQVGDPARLERIPERRLERQIPVRPGDDSRPTWASTIFCSATSCPPPSERRSSPASRTADGISSRRLRRWRHRAAAGPASVLLRPAPVRRPGAPGPRRAHLFQGPRLGRDAARARLSCGSTTDGAAQPGGFSDRLSLRRIPLPRLPQDRDHGQQPANAQSNIALAPAGTKFDRMWFTETAPALTLFDGTFRPVPRACSGQRAQRHKRARLDRVRSRIDRDKQASISRSWTRPFRHSGCWRRTRICSSSVTGRSSSWTESAPSWSRRPARKRLPVAGWTDANVATAWRADYFPPPPIPAADGNDATTNFDGAAITPFTLLVPAPGGRRIAQQTVPVDLKPAYSPRTLLPAGHPPLSVH